MRDLTGQAAVVTGAGSGIGRATAEVLASDGATVIVNDLDAERAETAAHHIRRNGGTAAAHAGDAADSYHVDDLLRACRETAGRIDILICNVGVYPTSLLEDVEVAEWDRVMRTNVTSAFLCIRAVAPVMREQGYGRIVVTSSVTGPLTAIAGLISYGASKSALTGLVRGAALELAPAGVTVNAVLPGTVRTSGVDASGGQRFLDRMTSSIPLGRPADPHEIGQAIRLLASPEASYISGIELIVDGGQRLPEGGAIDALAHTLRIP